MTAEQRAAAHVQALQDAGSQSKVRETAQGYEIEPPHKLGRLRAMGKGFLLRMLAGAPYGLGGMVGAGAAGTLEGGISPEHVQGGAREAEIARAQGDQATAQQLARGTLANTAASLNIQQDQEALKNMPVNAEEKAVLHERARRRYLRKLRDLGQE